VTGFWPVEDLAELAEGPTGCGEEARGGCLFAWNFSVMSSAVHNRGGEKQQAKHDAVAASTTRS
jgi:hypothetical protein